MLFIPCAWRSVYSSAGSCSWKQTRGFEISSGSGVGRFRRFVVFVLRQRRATSGNLQRRGRRGVEGANLKTSKTVRRNAFFENRSKYPTPSATSHALFSSPMNVLKRHFFYQNLTSRTSNNNTFRVHHRTVVRHTQRLFSTSALQTGQRQEAPLPRRVHLHQHCQREGHGRAHAPISTSRRENRKRARRCRRAPKR